jgi:outer membrane protein OmpA-like peptidoglycan-associated protein
MMVKITAAALGVGVMLASCASVPWRPTRAAIEVAPAHCADFQVSIYFERDGSRVSREARSVLDSAAVLAKGCRVDQARVVGLADAVGSDGANLDLSRRRAASVARGLRKAGFTQVAFDLAAAGEAGATSLSGAAAPLRRRADILVKMSPQP